MKILRYVLLIGLILALMAGCFAVGVFVGWRYKDINALPFLAGGEWAISRLLPEWNSRCSGPTT